MTKMTSSQSHVILSKAKDLDSSSVFDLLRMTTYFVLILIMIFLSSCMFSLDDFQNSRDPKNICGGIDLDDPITFYYSSFEVVDAYTTITGGNFGIILYFDNCTGFDYPDSDFALTQAENQEFSFLTLLDGDSTIAGSTANNPTYLLDPIAFSFLKSTPSSFDFGYDFVAAAGTEKEVTGSGSITLNNIKATLQVKSLVCDGENAVVTGKDSTCTLTLENIGYAKTDNLVINISENDASLVLTNATDLTASEILGGNGTASVTFNAQTPANLADTDFTLSINVVDAYENSWDLTATLTAKVPDITIASTIIDTEYLKPSTTSSITLDLTSDLPVEDFDYEINTDEDVTLALDSGNISAINLSSSLIFQLTTSSYVPNDSIYAYTISGTDSYGNLYSIDGALSTEPTGDLRLLIVDTTLTDTNEDDYLSPGESAILNIKIKNYGTTEYADVVGTLTTDNSDVTIDHRNDSDMMYFGTIASEGEACGYNDSTFGGTCDSTSPNDYILISVALAATLGDAGFTLTLTNATDATTSELSFQITINKLYPSLSYKATTLIINDTNEDAEISPNETAALKITIENTGGAKAFNVMGSLSEASSHASLSDDELFFGDISPSDEACGSNLEVNAGDCDSVTIGDYIQLTLSGDALPYAEGNEIPATLTLTDDEGTSYDNEEIDIPVDQHDPDFEVASVTVVGDDDGDGIISKGETGYLRIKLKDTGLAKGFSVSGTASVKAGESYAANVTIDTDNAQGPSDTLYFGDISISSTACGDKIVGSAGSCTDTTAANYMGVTLNSNAALTDDLAINFDLTVTDTLTGGVFTAPLHFHVNELYDHISLLASKTLVYDEDGDDTAEPGEDLYYQIMLFNNEEQGLHGLTGVYSTNVSCTTGCSLLNITDKNKVYFGDIEGSDIKCGTRANDTNKGSCTQSYDKYTGIYFSSGSTEATIHLIINDEYDHTWTVDIDIP